MGFRKICVIPKLRLQRQPGATGGTAAQCRSLTSQPLSLQHNGRPQGLSAPAARLRLPLGRAGGSAADMSLTSSDWAQRKPVGRFRSLEPDGPRRLVSVLYGRKRDTSSQMNPREKHRGGISALTMNRLAITPDTLWKEKCYGELNDAKECRHFIYCRIHQQPGLNVRDRLALENSCVNLLLSFMCCKGGWKLTAFSPYFNTKRKSSLLSSWSLYWCLTLKAEHLCFGCGTWEQINPTTLFHVLIRIYTSNT